MFYSVSGVFRFCCHQDSARFSQFMSYASVNKGARAPSRSCCGNSFVAVICINGTPYSLCGASKDVDGNTPQHRCHRSSGESVREDGAVEPESPETGARASACSASGTGLFEPVSAPASPRFSCSSRPFPRIFSMKKDDALAARLSIRFSCMFLLTYFTEVLRTSQADPLLSQSPCGHSRYFRLMLSRGDIAETGRGQPRASGRRRRQRRKPRRSTVGREVKRVMSRRHPPIGRAQRQMGFSKERRATLLPRVCVRACVRARPSRPAGRRETSVRCSALYLGQLVCK